MDEVERLFADFFGRVKDEPEKNMWIARHDIKTPKVTYFGKQYTDITETITNSYEVGNGEEKGIR